MAVTLSAKFENLTKVQRELEKIARGLSRELVAGIHDDAALLVAATRRYTPVGPGPQSPNDALPHIRDTYSTQVDGAVLALVSSHPGAVVHEFGGTIAPNRAPIHIRKSGMAHKAGIETLPVIEEFVSRRIDRLIRSNS